MIDIQVATGTVSGKLVYPDGDGPGIDTFIEFSITIGDNCCKEHAESAAEYMIRSYARAEGWIVQVDDN